VPLGVGEDVGVVWSFDDAGIFDTAGPFAGLLGVFGGIEDGFGLAGEVDAVGAGGQAEAGGVLADLHFAGVVFCSVEDVDFAVADDGGGVEGVERLPVDGGFADGVVEEGGFVGGDDRRADGAGEGADLPVWFGRGGEEEGRN